MGFLTDWVRNIFIMVAAVSFVEILLPAGSMGKYVKFILSLMILAVVLYPFSLLEGGKTPDPSQLLQQGQSPQTSPPYGSDPSPQPAPQGGSQDTDRLSTDSAMTAQLPVPADEDTLSSIQTKQIQQVYQEKLEQALKEQILSKFDGIQTASVHIYMNNDVTKRSYGKIRKAVIELAPASLADQVRSFAAQTLAIGRGQVQVTNAADQTGDTGG